MTDAPMSNDPPTHISFLILLALAEDDRHGYGILKEIEERSGGRISPSTGAMYLALQRMEEEGLLEPSPDRPRPGEDGRRKYYRLTAEGRARASEEARRMAQLVQVARERELMPGTQG